MSLFLSDCPSLMLGIAIHCIQHSQAILERGVCELAHSFFHYQILQRIRTCDSHSVSCSGFSQQDPGSSKVILNAYKN